MTAALASTGDFWPYRFLIARSDHGRSLVPDQTWPTVRQPSSVAVDGATGRLFIAGRADSRLELIDPGYPPARRCRTRGSGGSRESLAVEARVHLLAGRPAKDVPV